MDLTAARCLELADEHQANADLAYAQMSKVSSLSPDAALTLAQLGNIAAYHYSAAGYWLERRQAAIDEEGDRLDEESNDRFPLDDSPDDGPVRISVDKVLGTWALRVIVRDVLVSTWTADAVRQKFGEAGFLMLVDPLPTHAVDDEVMS